MSAGNPDIQQDTVIKVEKQIEEPLLYRVLLHNDDYTPREFVVQILETLFNKPRDEANALMWHVHRNGVGTCGLYPLEFAETKVMQATAVARENGFPLKLTIEPE